MRRLLLPLFLALTTAGAAGYFEWSHATTIADAARRLTGGDPGRGERKLHEYGCVACHDIPGVRGPSRQVGPPLDDIGARMYVAGAATNTPDELMRFLQHPRALVPQGAMPDLRVTEADARDLAAYLYSVR